MTDRTLKRRALTWATSSRRSPKVTRARRVYAESNAEEAKQIEDVAPGVLIHAQRAGPTCCGD